MKNSLKHSLQKKIKISDDAFETFFSYFQSQAFKKKDFLLNEGRICRHYFFINSGLTRTFYIDGKGKEIIVAFALEDWWLTELESFANQTPSRLYIQALEPTEVLAISHENLEKAFSEIPVLNSFFRILTQNMVIAFKKRHDFYLKENGKNRYDFIVHSLPEFVQRIPQHMLASYLGITPEYLSELRKKIS